MITFVKNLLGKENFLIVFGGDGATLVLPNIQYHKVKPELGQMQQLAILRFDLDHRVGVVQVQEIVRHNCKLQVALLKINDIQNLAVFQGGGLTKAEETVKNRGHSITRSSEKIDPPLQGLSCRWQPLPAKQGKIVSLLIDCRDLEKSTETLGEVITGLNSIFDDEIDSANPVNIIKARYKGLLNLLREESRLHQSYFTRGYARRMLEILISVFCFKYCFPLFECKDYVSENPVRSDYKKYDDTLRMVLDCRVEQIRQLKEFLQDLYQQGKIFYGIHESKQALMTCLVEGLSDGEHIHFIDGGDGGYAMAAQQMKIQMNA